MNRKEITLPESGEKYTIRKKSYYEIFLEDNPFEIELLFSETEIYKLDPKIRIALTRYRIEMACELIMEYPEGKKISPEKPGKNPDGTISFFDLTQKDQNFLIMETISFTFGGDGGNAEKFPEKKE